MTDKEKFIDMLLHEEVAMNVQKGAKLIEDFIKTCKQVLRIDVSKNDVVYVDDRLRYRCHGITIKGTPFFHEGKLHFIELEAVFNKPKRTWWRRWGTSGIKIVKEVAPLGSPRDLAFILDKYGEYNKE